MVATINDKTVNAVISSYEHTEKIIHEGSDEHLDIIIEVQNDLQKMADNTRALVEEIENDFNCFDKETAKEAIIKLLPIFRLSAQITGLIKRSFIYSGVKTHLKKLNLEVEELKEFVNDLQRYKIKENADLIALLNNEN